jgi:hypothetical protein
MSPFHLHSSVFALESSSPSSSSTSTLHSKSTHSALDNSYTLEIPTDISSSSDTPEKEADLSKREEDTEEELDPESDEDVVLIGSIHDEVCHFLFLSFPVCAF